MFAAYTKCNIRKIPAPTAVSGCQIYIEKVLEIMSYVRQMLSSPGQLTLHRIAQRVCVDQHLRLQFKNLASQGHICLCHLA